MKIDTDNAPVKRLYVPRLAHERAVSMRDKLKKRCRQQEARIENLNKQVIYWKELAEATGALQFHPRQEAAAVRRYNAARGRVKA